MSVSGVGGASGAAQALSGSGSQQDAGAQAVQNFLDYMKETPAQRFEDQWLNAHGISRQAFNAMSPQKQQALLKQMAADIKRQAQMQAENTSKTSKPNA